MLNNIWFLISGILCLELLKLTRQIDDIETNISKQEDNKTS